MRSLNKILVSIQPKPKKGLVDFIVSCDRQADIVSKNISLEAEEFQIYRRVVFYNGITDAYILQVEGYCSVSTEDGRLAVTIKTEDGTFLKHYLGLSDNVTYFTEHLKPSKVSNKNA